jgi:hypothetical protein
MTVFKDICSGRGYEKNGDQKVAWTRVGTLIEKDGKQYVKLEAIPLPNEKGEVFLSVFEQRQKDSRQQSGSGGNSSDLVGDGSVPF